MNEKLEALKKRLKRRPRHHQLEIKATVNGEPVSPYAHCIDIRPIEGRQHLVYLTTPAGERLELNLTNLINGRRFAPNG